MFKTFERPAFIWLLTALIGYGVSSAKDLEDYVKDLGIEGTYYEDPWSSNDKIRRAKEQLRRAGPEAVPLLLSALEEKGKAYRWTYDKDKDVLYEPDEKERRRKRALTVLGDIGDPLAVSKLREVATDVTENQTVRKDAVEALGRIGTDEALEVILSLKLDDDYEVREGVAYALRFFDDPRALAALKELVYDSKVDVTVVAAFSLRYFDDPSMDGIACDLLKDYYYKGRLAGLLLFNERRPNVSYYNISSLFNDPHPLVANAAARMFRGDGGVHSDVLVRKFETAKYPIERGVCVYAMGLTGDPALGVYVDMASKDADAAVRASYCASAGFLYGPDRINEIAVMLNDNDEYVRLFALNGIENIGSRYEIDDVDLIERCRPFLSKDESYEPGAAALVLTELGDGESIENIEELSDAKAPKFKKEDFHDMDALLIGGYSELEDFAGMMTAYIGRGLRNPFFFRYDTYYLKGGFIPARTFIWGPGAGEGTRIINYGNRFALKMVEGAALTEDTKDNFSYYRKRHILGYNVISSVVAMRNSAYDDFDYYKGLLGKGDGAWDETALRGISYFDSEEAEKTAKKYIDDEFTDVRIAAIMALARQSADGYMEDVKRARDKSESPVETLVCNIALAKFGDSEAVRLVAEDFEDIEMREDLILYSGYAAYGPGLEMAWDNYDSLLHSERDSYVMALNMSGTETNLERLLEIASTDPDPSIRWVALRTAERLSKKRKGK
jgi:HEAT repeat protein